ncbi:MAG TPA: hypothetical protein VNO24_13815 [Blastocatellia bacterium]|nr:hypothetical protein [Blastocatellia bacterium]
MKAIQSIKKGFARASYLYISFATGVWIIIRAAIYRLRIGPRRDAPFDLPLLFGGSPVGTEYNMAFTLSLNAFIGVITAITAVLKYKKWPRYFALFTCGINVGAWWYAVSLIEWALNPPPGVDY